jgi:hypothetical protein
MNEPFVIVLGCVTKVAQTLIIENTLPISKTWDIDSHGHGLHAIFFGN